MTATMTPPPPSAPALALPETEEEQRALLVGLQEKIIRQRLSFDHFAGQRGASTLSAEAVLREGLQRVCMRMNRKDWVLVKAMPNRDDLDHARRTALDRFAAGAGTAPEAPPGDARGWTPDEWTFAQAVFFDTVTVMQGEEARRRTEKAATDAAAARKRAFLGRAFHAILAVVTAIVVYRLIE